MKSKIDEIVELGHPRSLIHRIGEPIDEIIDTEMMLQELNRQLAAPAVSNSAEYTRGYRDGWRDCCEDVKEFG